MTFHLCPPCLIFTRDDLGSRNGEKIYGLSNGPLVWVLKGANGGALAHELVHVKQYWCHGLIIHQLLLYYPPYRAWCEKQAMEKQLNWKP